MFHSTNKQFSCSYGDASTFYKLLWVEYQITTKKLQDDKIYNYYCDLVIGSLICEWLIQIEHIFDWLQ